jgi:low affinity Fe/Cu permease
VNLFPKNFIIRHQAKLFFIVVWGHVTILDLCYVTYSGPIFFWKENLQPYTLFIHLTVSFLTLTFYFLLMNILTRLRANKTAKSPNSTKDNSH